MPEKFPAYPIDRNAVLREAHRRTILALGDEPERPTVVCAAGVHVWDRRDENAPIEPGDPCKKCLYNRVLCEAHTGMNAENEHTVRPYEYKGRDRRGTAVTGRTLKAPLGFVEIRYRRGWLDLRVCDVIVGDEVGGITHDPNSGRRMWWADSDAPDLSAATIHGTSTPEEDS